MSTIYYFYVGTPVDIASRVTSLDSKLSIDFDISSNYTSTVYNGVTEVVEVTYSSPLSSSQILVLNSLTAIILYDAVVGENVYVEDTDASVRKSYGVSSIPTSSYDENSGYAVGSLVITNTNSIYICTDNTIGNAVWVEHTQSETLPLNFAFTQPNGNGLETSQNNWLRIADFIYNGTASSDGTISKALVIAYTTNTNTYHRWRILNVTSSLLIATSTQVNTGTSGDPVTINLGPISNLPSGPSTNVFELQALATDATGNTGIAGRQNIGIFTVQVYP